MLERLQRFVCTILDHRYDERECHDMWQVGGVQPVCFYDVCTRCGLERHENSLYCDRVEWKPGYDAVTYRPPPK